MNQVRRALMELAAESRPYTVLDKAIAEGLRRRRRHRRVGSTLATVGVVTVLGAGYAAAGPEPGPSVRPSGPVATAPVGASPTDSGSVVGPSACVGSVLPVPSGFAGRSVAIGGDPSGRFVLGRAYESGQARMVMWTDGRPSVVELPGSGDELRDVTTYGLAVGSSYDGGRSRAYRYENGVFVRLPEQDAAATTVNERGDVAGTAGDRPVVWRSGSTAAQRLPVPNVTVFGDARGIDEDGTVVGSVTTPGAHAGDEAVAWAYAWSPDGTAQVLPIPHSDAGPVTSAWATSVRNGWVSGTARIRTARGDAMYAVLWNLRTKEVSLSDQIGPGEVVNARGWRAGRGADGPVLLTAGALIRLPLPTASRFDEAVGVSDDGTVVVGTRYDPADSLASAAMVWRCR
ncbi:MAG: hypothetical protein HOU81_26890 [Hamadaea sp.]|uniref:hypothetical protein n=1 Tax=Hamadaea sp. TaxID=2024425 RepID=UPI0017A0989F|nr:hypothetical protein [Hamadaea sp.]NUR74454.1 hypothetical protein [Hamadaea sp.]NUT18962.1 hypothetical protein [Hamadaea sp.]